MTLTLDQVKKITRGWVSLIEEDGQYVFNRFSEPAKDYYLQTSPRDFYVKTFATSGICFDFVTDSTSFSFDFTVKGASSRKFYYFDVYVDGVMRQHLGEQEMWICRGNIKLPLPAGAHRVTVWFPCLAAARISNVTLDDEAFLEPAAYEKKMICYGDSISQGYDAVYPSLAYTNRLAQHFNAYMINQAIGGEKFVPGILDPDFAKDFVPDIITVAYGTNDWSGFEKELFETRCDGFLKGLAELYPTTKVFILTPIWRGDHGRITKVGRFEDMVEFVTKTAEKYGHNVIYGYNLTPHVPAFYSDLRLHPNDLGYGEYTRNLIPEIEKKL